MRSSALSNSARFLSLPLFLARLLVLASKWQAPATFAWWTTLRTFHCQKAREDYMLDSAHLFAFLGSQVPH
ncbi:hypothetical protein BX591_1062 [Paraburkholderia bryophila]|uniref:Uncharacterized protein n=1 Tax=Paraburkholderia bryophila TaxID=420952 RepID=A0A329CKS6_9BURK|nr:hypothetical protein BX591_1062 [Paraburkholderia bryophila]